MPAPGATVVEVEVEVEDNGSSYMDDLASVQA